MLALFSSALSLFPYFFLSFSVLKCAIPIILIRLQSSEWQQGRIKCISIKCVHRIKNLSKILNHQEEEYINICSPLGRIFLHLSSFCWFFCSSFSILSSSFSEMRLRAYYFVCEKCGESFFLLFSPFFSCIGRWWKKTWWYVDVCFCVCANMYIVGPNVDGKCHKFQPNDNDCMI